MSTNVTPYTSPNDPSPFVPSGSSSGSSGSGSGSSIPSNAPVPDLAIVVGAPPDFAPDLGAGSGSGSGSSSSSAPPVTDDFAIDLAGLRGAESSLIGASSSIVDAYTQLKALFESGKDTVFGQTATTTGAQHTGGDGDGANVNNGESEPTIVTQTNADPIQSSAVAFANGSDGNPGMNDVEAYVLQQVGNAMGLLGQFLAMMNGAGWSYAQADASSMLPSTAVGGGSDPSNLPPVSTTVSPNGTVASAQSGSAS